MQELEKILEEMKKIKDGNRKENLYAKYPPKDEQGKILNGYSQGYEDGTDNFYNVMVDIIRKHTNDGWIPVEERLPEESLNSVIGWDEERKRCCFVQRWGGRWIFGNDIDSVKITAWRPLPEPYRPERSRN